MRWLHPKSGDWNVSQNWVGWSVPNPGDKVILESNEDIQIVGPSQAIHLTELWIGAGLSNGIGNGVIQLVIDGDQLSVDRRVHISANGTLAGSGTVTGDVIVEGRLKPENGQLAVNGDLSFSSDAELHLDFSFDDSQNPYLSASRTMELDGSLHVTNMHDNSEFIEPGDLDKIVLIESPNVTGQFETIEFRGIPLDTGANLVTNKDSSTTVFLTVTATDDAVSLTRYVPLLGDANGDMTVDDLDLAIWMDNRFSNNVNWLSADFNGDRLTDAKDFNIWNEHKFTTVSSEIAVPEAISLSRLLLFLGFLVIRGRENNVKHSLSAPGNHERLLS